MIRKLFATDDSAATAILRLVAGVVFFAHGAQDLTAGQRRTDRIAIGSGVRGQHKPVTLFDVFENIFQHKDSRRSSVGLSLVVGSVSC